MDTYEPTTVRGAILMTDNLQAVRELVAKWRAEAPLCKTPGYGEAMRENADVLESTLAQAPAVRLE